MKESHIRVIKLFGVMSNPTRFKILDNLAEKHMSVTQIRELINKNKSTTSKHLRILRLANLIKYKYVNKEKFYMVKSKKIVSLIKKLEEAYSRLLDS